MNKYVEEQRPDHLVRLSRSEDTNYTFAEYDHEVSVSDASDGFEWWFPYANGLGYRSVIHNATLSHNTNVLGFGHVRLCLQSPDEQTRTMVHEFTKFAGMERVTHEYVVPRGARGILTIEGAVALDIFKARYLVERRR